MKEEIKPLKRGDKVTYNPDIAKMHYKKNRELRAKANEKGEIWRHGDGWAMVIQL